MGKRTKRLLGVGILAAIAIAVWRVWQKQTAARPRDVEWTTAPFPFPPEPRPAHAPEPAPEPAREPEPAAAGSVEPNGDGSCPLSHPVKGKLKSGIYHVPGGANYDRTKPDRCYADEDAAQADGLRRSKA